MTKTLPYVKINYQNGSLGITTPSEDGICGLIPGGAVVVGTSTKQVVAGTLTAYKINSLDCVTKTGTDALTYEMIREFYAEAGDGAFLWVLGAKPTNIGTGVTDLCYAANGEIRTVAVTSPSTAIDTDLKACNDAAIDIADKLYAPVVVILNITVPTTIGQAIDLTEKNYSHCAVMCGNELTGNNATDTLLKAASSIGLLLGRIAAEPVHRSVGRVRSGAIKAVNMSFGAKEINMTTSGNVNTLNGKGYIVPRTFVGKSGFYWSDDSMACDPTDDYGLLTRRRTIDKAYRITYQALLDEVGEEVAVSANGKMSNASVKAIQGAVSTALENAMTAEGNLGTDPDDSGDTGVKVVIDPEQDVVATSKVEVSVSVKPYAYSKYIEVKLGFYTSTTND